MVNPKYAHNVLHSRSVALCMSARLVVILNKVDMIPEAKRAKKDEIEAVRKDAETGRDLTFEEALNKRDVQQIDAAVENVAKRAKCKISAPNTTRAEPQEVEEEGAHEQPDDEGEQPEQVAVYNAMGEDQPDARLSNCNVEGTTEEGVHAVIGNRLIPHSIVRYPRS